MLSGTVQMVGFLFKFRLVREKWRCRTSHREGVVHFSLTGLYLQGDLVFLISLDVVSCFMYICVYTDHRSFHMRKSPSDVFSLTIYIMHECCHYEKTLRLVRVF